MSWALAGGHGGGLSSRAMLMTNGWQGSAGAAAAAASLANWLTGSSNRAATSMRPYLQPGKADPGISAAAAAAAAAVLVAETRPHMRQQQPSG